MFVEEKMYWPVPFPIEFVESCRIPPILVESSITKISEFSENIAVKFKYKVEEHEREYRNGKNHAEITKEPLTLPKIQ